MNMNMDMDMSGAMMAAMGTWFLLWTLVALAVLTLAVVASVWLIKNIKSGGAEGRSGVEEHLQQRYAAGEIDREDYLQRKADLQAR